MYCVYYQAKLKKSQCWIVTASLKYFDGIAFDRAFNPAEDIFEFFVAPSREQEFLSLMHWFEKKELVSDIKKLPNRMAGT